MIVMRMTLVALAGAGLLGGCQPMTATAKTYCSEAPEGKIPVMVTTKKGRHCFEAERAVTTDEQAKGLMFRTDLGPESAMLFWPYPAVGPPRVASFYMKNTPTSLDILFIRADGTVESIAENTVPFSEDSIPSDEPVAAVLELVAGRSAELGIEEDDKVSWPRPPAAN